MDPQTQPTTPPPSTVDPIQAQLDAMLLDIEKNSEAFKVDSSALLADIEKGIKGAEGDLVEMEEGILKYEEDNTHDIDTLALDLADIEEDIQKPE